MLASSTCGIMQAFQGFGCNFNYQNIGNAADLLGLDPKKISFLRLKSSSRAIWECTPLQEGRRKVAFLFLFSFFNHVISAPSLPGRGILAQGSCPIHCSHEIIRLLGSFTSLVRSFMTLRIDHRTKATGYWINLAN